MKRYRAELIRTGSKHRLLQTILGALAVAFAGLGGYILIFGLVGRSYDSTMWQYVFFGAPFLVMAVGFAIALRHTRRRP